MARSRSNKSQPAKPARRRHAAARARPYCARRPRPLLAVFAHDIRTALTGILALGELLASSNLGERERRWASGIKTSAEHLASLTTLVIDAAKADGGLAHAAARAFRPRRLIEALADSLRRAPKPKACAPSDGRR